MSKADQTAFSGEELRILKELENYDTPSITNVVATYPNASTCLKLYDAWEDNWYTDQSLHAMYPELGRTCGVAVTCVYSIPGCGEDSGLTLRDVLHAVKDSPKPVVLVIKQHVPDHLKGKIGLCGGNMMTAFRALGAVAVITDGPSRDVDEVRGMGMQYMLTGTCAGHGPFLVEKVNVPVQVCGMDVQPGEIIHMDENGAVKFPRDCLKHVLENCRILAEEEKLKMSKMAAADDPDLIFETMKGNYR